MHRLFNTKNKVLKDLITKSQEADTLSQLVAGFLDAELAAQCKVVQFQKGCLTIAISSAPWATKFRFYNATLLSQLRTAGKLYNLRSIKTIIEQPCLQPVEKQHSKPTTLSKTSADIISQAAKNISSERLRAALESLAASTKAKMQ